MAFLRVTSGDEFHSEYEDVTVNYDEETKIVEALDKSENVVATMGVTWHQGDSYRGTRLYGTQPLAWEISSSKPKD